MRDLLNLIRWVLLGLLRSRSSIEAENLALRHQLNVLRRRSPKRPVLRNFDCLIFIYLYRIAPRILDALTIVEPATVVRWHRAGFRSFWRWKSRRRAGKPQVFLELRQLILEMSRSGALPAIETSAKRGLVGQEAERVVGLGARSAACAVARALIWRLEPASQVRPAAARRRLNAMAIRSTCKRFAASPR